MGESAFLSDVKSNIDRLKQGKLDYDRFMGREIDERVVRVGVIGCGDMGGAHFAGLNNVNNCKYCLPNYTPIEDIATFEDVANAAWYLGSDQSRNTTGAEIVVDGGMLAQLTPNINRELWK